MDSETKCPVCTYPAGTYRLGTCSPECDRVLGDEEPYLLILALMFIAAVPLITWVVLTYV